LLLAVSDSVARRVSLFDTATGQRIAVVDGRGTDATDSGYSALRFAPDGSSFEFVEGTRPDPGSERLDVRTATWSLRPEDWVKAACTMVSRDLTEDEWRRYVSPTLPWASTCGFSG
jgi:hypothetical protein